MPSYYLWRGVDAIEDLEDCTSDEQARAALEGKVTGDWTLWKRMSYQEEVAKGVGYSPQAKLLGVKLCDSGETFNFNVR